MGNQFKSFPRGKLNEQNEGEVQLAVGVQQDVVVLAFPHPVTWVGLLAEQAEELAHTILQRAKEARRNRQ